MPCGQGWQSLHSVVFSSGSRTAEQGLWLTLALAHTRDQTVPVRHSLAWTALGALLVCLGSGQWGQSRGILPARPDEKRPKIHRAAPLHDLHLRHFC